jgi:hypothetical protein
VLAVLLALVVAACDGADVAPPAAVGPGPAAGTPPVTTGAFIVVLPPADGLAEPERARVRMLVDRAFESAVPGAPAPTVLEPATQSAYADSVELAVRRAGADGTVCVLGAGAVTVLAPVLARYPAARVCALPAAAAAAADWPGVLLDVDLEQLGRALGLAARAAAGDGGVIVLSGSDAMLDLRWRAGVTAGALVTAGTPTALGGVHVAATAADVLVILDEQARLIAAGIAPGSAGAVAGLDVDGGLPPELSGIPVARVLPPVAVVVLDASSESALLIGPLAERGVRVVAPRSLLLAAGEPEDTVVLRWRVRWDIPLALLLRQLGGSGGATAGDDPIVLEPGPAHVAP